MTKLGKRHTLMVIALTYLVCAIVKYIEFFFIQTEQTFIADNVICKLWTILILVLALRATKSNFDEIGFAFSSQKNRSAAKESAGFLGRSPVRYGLFGFALGIATFAISYFVEILILRAQGKTVSLAFYVTNFALSGATNSVALSVPALLICIAGNIINVVAEEGLFRGLFLHLAEKPFGFRKANFLQAFLFGIWHLVSVALELRNGTMTLAVAAVMALGYIVLAGMLALEWGTCVSLTGVLWAGICEHFFNNFIGNTLHVVTESGTDELQIARIVLSNVLSLAIVLMLSKKKGKR